MKIKHLGFKVDDLDVIKAILKKYPQVEQAIVFGSRAKGNFKPGSDVDIVLNGNVNDIVTDISFSLNEDSLLPYKFDVLDYNSITNQNLLDHISRVGIIFYEKNKEDEV
jgi:predicted nucleotidyltransferase